MPELVFKGKEFVYNHHLTVPFRPLEPHPDKSIGDVRLDGNLIIHGDNLHALKALMPMYAGKVDCIFIDPPYNTGNEGWCYNDNVNSPVIQEWLNNNPVGIEDGLRHDKWCAMMYPRLKLLHELLSESGSMWLTLDDNEVHNAICMLNEIFGESNNIAFISWEKVYSPRMDASGFSKDFDSVLVYAKDIDQVALEKVAFIQNDRAFTYIDPETNRNARLRTLRKEGSNSLRTDRPNMWYPIEAPDGTEIWPIKPDGTEGCWRWEKPNFDREIVKTPRKVLIQKNDNGVWEVFVKQYYEGETYRPPSSIFRYTDYGHTHEASAELKAIFGRRGVFATSKPTKLIRGILSLALPEDGIVLDSFAGSGTTAHAVLAENEKDSGSRKFILVECEDYADRLTAERVRKVIQGYESVGKQRFELMKGKLTWTKIRNCERMLKEISSLEEEKIKDFDVIKKSVKNGYLIITGEKTDLSRIE